MKCVNISIVAILAVLIGSAYGVQQSVTTPLNPARNLLIGVGVNDFIFFAGGYKSFAATLMDTYNTKTNTWNQTDFGCEVTAATSVGKYALFHCYNDNYPLYSSVIHIFDSVSQVWSSKFFENGTFGPLAISCGQYALFGGGYINSVWAFDSTDQSWRTMPLTRRSAVAECTNNYAIYVARDGAVVNVVNVVTGLVNESTISNTNGNRAISKAGKYILIAGGTGNTYPSFSNHVDVFNTETQTWSTSQISEGKQLISTTSVGTFAIFAGGAGEYGLRDTVDIFDAATMTWSTATLARAGYKFSTIVVGPYAMIGGGETYSEWTSSINVFNSTDQTWFVLNLSTPRIQMGTATTGNIAMWAGGFRTTRDPLFDVVDVFDFTENIGSTPPVTPIAAPLSGVSSVVPTDDATVRNGIYANNNYALEPTMYIKYSTNPDFTRQIFVKFPIHNLLPIGTSRVVVKLLGYYQSTLGPLNVQCYSVPNSSWSQSNITWNNKPALGGLLSSTDIIHPIAYYEWDVTSYVAGQQLSGASFVSFAFVRNTPGPDESTVLINSLEADVNRPIMAIA